jgi:hypothetical protein
MNWEEAIIVGLVSLVVLVIGLIIEYRTGLFHPTESKRDWSVFRRLWRDFIRPFGSWLWKQRHYILLAVLFICLEGTLYWLAGLKLVTLSVVHLALVALAIVLLFAPKRPTVASSLDATSGLVERIDFDYLPKSPTSERGGWVLFTEGEPPKFNTANYLGEKALRVQKVDYYSLDRDVRTDSERPGRVVEYVTRLKSEGVIYAHIYVQSKDHAKSEESWIQFRVETSRRSKPHAGNEWVLYITPKDELKEGWQLFRENLIDATKQTFGKEGKSFERLIGFRLRGNLDLAYISVFES